MGVVDQLEAVDVQEDDGDAVTGLRALGEGRRDRALDEGPVAEPGQGVVGDLVDAAGLRGRTHPDGPPHAHRGQAHRDGPEDPEDDPLVGGPTRVGQADDGQQGRGEHDRDEPAARVGSVGRRAPPATEQAPHGRVQVRDAEGARREQVPDTEQRVRHRGPPHVGGQVQAVGDGEEHHGHDEEATGQGAAGPGPDPDERDRDHVDVERGGDRERATLEARQVHTRRGGLDQVDPQEDERTDPGDQRLDHHVGIAAVVGMRRPGQHSHREGGQHRSDQHQDVGHQRPVGVDDGQGVPVEPDPTAEGEQDDTEEQDLPGSPARWDVEPQPAGHGRGGGYGHEDQRGGMGAPRSRHPVEDGHRGARHPECGRHHRCAVAQPPPGGSGRGCGGSRCHGRAIIGGARPAGRDRPVGIALVSVRAGRSPREARPGRGGRPVRGRPGPNDRPRRCRRGPSGPGIRRPRRPGSPAPAGAG